MIKRLTYLIVLLTFFALVSCGDDLSSQQPSPSKPAKKQNIEKPKENVEPEQVVEKYIYNPLGKRDPFESPFKATAEVKPEDGVPLTPLQKFDLGQLRLIGVIIGKGEPRAMVIAPDGKSFILTTGTKVGKNDGVVVGITTDAVQVKEKYFDFTGEIRTGIQEIKLPKQGGVK